MRRICCLVVPSSLQWRAFPTAYLFNINLLLSSITNETFNIDTDTQKLLDGFVMGISHDWKNNKLWIIDRFNVVIAFWPLNFCAYVRLVVYLLFKLNRKRKKKALECFDMQFKYKISCVSICNALKRTFFGK